MKQRRAEIVGAGFAGLAAACALAQRGWTVRVHERADRLRTTGAGIYIY
jgi:2-polyprenyl-6-methoxyphenol hydroxylase-like FAD-dependent oxidoreductase